MTDADLAAENRRLRRELARSREDLAHTRERLGYALSHVAELRRRVPDTVRQAAAPGTSRASDPLERLFAAISRGRAVAFIVAFAAALTGCATVGDQSASLAVTPQAQCERDGIRWIVQLNFCEHMGKP